MWQSFVNLLASALEGVHGVTGNYGVAIIVLTLVIRLALLPLTHSGTRSMRRMQKIQPEMKKIQDKYKDDPTKMNEEIAALWREHKVSPLQGCLPTLLQMPILFAFFHALRGFDFTGNPGFLWITNLAEPDAFILPVLAGLSTFLQTYVTSAGAGDTSQRMMLYGMPLFLGFMSRQFPAGLALYWVVQNLIGAGHQYYLKFSEASEQSGASGGTAGKKKAGAAVIEAEGGTVAGDGADAAEGGRKEASGEKSGSRGKGRSRRRSRRRRRRG